MLTPWKSLPIRQLAVSVVMASAAAIAVLAPAQSAIAQVRTLPDFTDLVDQVGPSVVNIRTLEKVAPRGGAGASPDDEMLEFFRRFGLPMPNMPRQAPRPNRQGPEEEQPKGVGSGFIFSSDGLIMTNAHVVGTETSVTVRTADGKSWKGQVLGADTGTDIAVVKVSGLSAPAATLSTEKPVVGQIAVAVGSPFGLTQSVTSGIVSAVNRPVDNEKGVVVNMIQTDASINPGNSGGALSNRAGQIIGINTAIFSQTGENNGIGFAIPIATARNAADKLVAGQSVARAGLGLSGPTDTPNGDSGAYVKSVTPGGAADQGGIRAGDIITSVDGTTIHSFDELRGTISAYTPGDKVVVTIQRDGQSQSLTVTLGAMGTK